MGHKIIVGRYNFDKLPLIRNNTPFVWNLAISANNYDEQELNYFGFAFFSGLRSPELIKL
jgi:hypothetical protein